VRRRRFLYVMGGLASLKAYGNSGWALPGSGAGAPRDRVVGMYIHQHWPYNHPYAARTWTVENYRGYADGLKKLGYNTLVIWPLLETMPDPLTPSDQANLEKISKVIDVLHDELGIQVFLTLCPNIVGNNQEAAKLPFQKRHFFYSDRFVDPGDPVAVKRMIDWREKLLRPLAKMDGVAIIDSDPGGYPGSTNDQFAHLLGEHRKMLDRLRSGIELCYWMHVGWEAYCRFYQTGNFEWGTPAEAVDVLTRLEKVNPKPWGITIHTMEPPPNGTDLNLAERFGLASSALAFNYGAIESEPSFPMTNFGDDAAFKAGQASAPGGVVGNAQTHCVQLPNTFAFARGATGKTPPTERDYVEYADGLVSGQGQLIVQGWQALAANDPGPMRGAADKLEGLANRELTPGSLKGLLFGDPGRFITDLVMELRLKAAYRDFVVASEKNQDIRAPLQHFIAAADAWQQRHGYECAWSWPKLAETLKTLKSPAIDAVLDEKGEGSIPSDRVADQLRKMETYTSRLLEAMKETLKHV
jgi:hypothetical protein